MIAALGPRVAIIGNSGSGKTTLARRIAEQEGLPVTDLDRIHWQGKVLQPRDQQAALAMVAEIAAAPCWIIEGVYGWLAAPALSRATALIWLDLPWAVCRSGLDARGPWAAPAPNSIKPSCNGRRTIGAVPRRRRFPVTLPFMRPSMVRNGG